ncbi:outer membrane protein with beta-barrel domain [Humitalea rosea]|uniref:Outer membrane protein with beta-barrel domain n=1 Tax=Humitalea rosea TaxID=990373 RepID=A0A2W7IIP0_9PROT|nr:OmpA family protein [Humitalea rosea]PZW46750.1 outer membrane protein with beta-barrel domain [Humitalea rosea]
MNLKTALLAATVLSLPLAAQAQPVSGVYIGGGAGVNFLQDSDLSVANAAGRTALTNAGIGTRTGTASFETGYVGVLSIGYGFGNGVRAELEGNFRSNKIDSISGFRGATGNRAVSGGFTQSYGVMANALYDFDLGLPVVPYVGLGAGYVIQNWDNVRSSAPGVNGVRIDGDDGRFAYQAIVGAALPIEAVPGLSLTAEYRFLGTLSPEVDGRVTTPTGVVTAGRAKIETENFNHSLLVGLRYAFGVAPAPVPVVVTTPPAAPAPARTYLVFFDWDRADLTDRARQIIGEAATNSRRVQVTRIEVSGHADRSGTPQYNQRLSLRRAETVAAELTRLGVAREQIVVQAFGESRPLVPTADGVREPQNRRVEIVLR